MLLTWVLALVTFAICLAVYALQLRHQHLAHAVPTDPMIFELPFDLMVMSRTYPAVPPDPAVYRALFFLPLFLVEVITLWLLTRSPRMKLSRIAMFCLAGMFAVFAVWALFGMAYPSAPIPIALNIVSKLLAFATVLCLFLPLRTRSSAEESASAAST